MRGVIFESFLFIVGFKAFWCTRKTLRVVDGAFDGLSFPVVFNLGGVNIADESSCGKCCRIRISDCFDNIFGGFERGGSMNGTALLMVKVSDISCGNGELVGSMGVGAVLIGIVAEGSVFPNNDKRRSACRAKALDRAPTASVLIGKLAKLSCRNKCSKGFEPDCLAEKYMEYDLAHNSKHVNCVI